MPIVDNKSGHAFHFPGGHGLTREPGEPEEHFSHRVQRSGRQVEAFFVPPGRTELTDRQLDAIDGHEVARHWFKEGLSVVEEEPPAASDEGEE